MPSKYPKPFRGLDDDALFDPSIQQHLPLLVALGGICAVWSTLERFTALLYRLLVLGERDDKDVAEETVMEALELIVGWQTKAKLIKKAAKRRLGDVPAVSKLEKLLDRVDRVQKRRNNVVHGFWSTAPSEPERWIRRRWMFAPDPEVYDLAALLDIKRTISELTYELAALFQEFKPQLRVTSAMSKFIEAVMAPATEEQSNNG